MSTRQRNRACFKKDKFLLNFIPLFLGQDRISGLAAWPDSSSHWADVPGWADQPDWSRKVAAFHYFNH
jgi:hypothetical protein